MCFAPLLVKDAMTPEASLYASTAMNVVLAEEAADIAGVEQGQCFGDSSADSEVRIAS